MATLKRKRFYARNAYCIKGHRVVGTELSVEFPDGTYKIIREFMDDNCAACGANKPFFYRHELVEHAGVIANDYPLTAGTKSAPMEIANRQRS